MDTSRSRSYRAELLDLIPTAAKRILVLNGDGTADVREAIRACSAAEVVEIDINQVRMDRCTAGGDPSGGAESAFDPHSFDCVVCGDVLASCSNPVGLLRWVRGWLKPEGRIVAGFANVRQHGVVTALLGGHWTYGSPGALATHPARLFARREIEKLLFRAGYSLNRILGVHGPGHLEWEQGGRLGDVQVGPLRIQGLATRDAEEFFLSEFLADATPAPPRDFGVTSIVIITHNELPFTRLCVESIQEFTDEPYELVFVDNASTDGTIDYLEAIAGAIVIKNDSNRGFPAAVNQGIRASNGKQIVLLNNDCIVTTGWLRRLLESSHSDPKIGLAGPCSNFVSGPQQVAVSYKELTELDGFAWDWGRANHGLTRDSNRLVGFCLLIRREVIDTIGLFDEQFGMGCFEDDDYCRRAIRAGYRAVIALDAFVHHFGGRTFIASGVDFGALMQRNERLYREKWESVRGQGSGFRVQESEEGSQSSVVSSQLSDSGSQPSTINVQLSLCMIVRDNERTIRAALESIKPWVDEMVVVDTGSTDRTPEIAASFDARVFHFPWCDDFSAARNESIRHARGQLIFWMDSDDTIEPDNGRKLREVAARPLPTNVLGYLMQVHCPGPDDAGGADVTVVDHVKLFRNLPALRFEGRVHEQILPSIRRAGGVITWADVSIVHSGSDQSAEGRARKRERDLRLLHMENDERPNQPFTLFNLGMTYLDAAEYEQATEYLSQCITRSSADESHVRKAFSFLISAHGQCGRRDLAWDTCQRGLALFPEDSELRFRQARLLHDAGRLADAVHAYLSVLESPPERYLSSMDRGIRGHLTRQNLATVYVEIGELAKAEEQWRMVVAELPKYAFGWRGLGDVLIRQGKLGDALLLATQLLEHDALRAEGKYLHDRVRRVCPDAEIGPT